MAANEPSLIAMLRDEIERKYREALAALDTISGYVSTAPAPSNVTAVPAKTPTLFIGASHSNVDRVLGALNTHDAKTVAQIHAETGLPEEAVRAVLYAKAAAKRVHRKKIGNLTAFALKASAAHPSNGTHQ